MKERSHKWLYGILTLMVFSAWAADSRGEMPTGQLAFIALLLLFVLMLIGEVLDRLSDLARRMKQVAHRIAARVVGKLARVGPF